MNYYEYVESKGTKLYTAILLPQAEGTFPTVVIRSPYVSNHRTPQETCDRLLEKTLYTEWVDHGYAVVLQHCRGCGMSEGDCIPFINERDDTLNLYDWIRRQPFYNGELYLYGGSYRAFVHLAAAPFAADIKGAAFDVVDHDFYNVAYRNGFYKSSLLGNWYVRSMYKKNSRKKWNYTENSFNTLPISNFSKIVFDESVEAFDAILQHPKKEDPFWQTHIGGNDSIDALKNADIPILLTTGYYDIYTGGNFDMWHSLDEKTKSKSALAVHPFGHDGSSNGHPIAFENGTLTEAFGSYALLWIDAIRHGKKPPFKAGQITYYKTFEDQWGETPSFNTASKTMRIPLGNGAVTYRYNPYDPASFKGGLSTTSGGNQWQDPPNSRHDIISLFTPEFTEDTVVFGKMNAKLKVRSSCEDTCFYIRLSLCKEQGDYGLRDDINQISNFDVNYIPGTDLEMDFTFDEHSFMVKKGEKLRIDISSSNVPHYVRHTNQKGLFSEQTTAKIADNTVILDESYIELPIK